MIRDDQGRVASFSGAHPFRPACLVDTVRATRESFEGPVDEVEVIDLAAGLVEVIESGRCPRCERPFGAREIPSGSRWSRCRCIPVCSTCSADEPFVAGSHPEWDAGPWDWPIRQADVDERHEERLATMPKGLIAQADERVAESEFLVVSDDGVSPLRFRPHPGGWSEFGFTADDDDEQRGR